MRGGVLSCSAGQCFCLQIKVKCFKLYILGDCLVPEEQHEREALECTKSGVASNSYAYSLCASEESVVDGTSGVWKVLLLWWVCATGGWCLLVDVVGGLGLWCCCKGDDTGINMMVWLPCYGRLFLLLGMVVSDVSFRLSVCRSWRCGGMFVLLLNGGSSIQTYIVVKTH